MDGFVKTPAGFVPRVKTNLTLRDHFGSVRARMGIARNQYRINPGLYCAGNPSNKSPVFVTANYKLSFDSLRKELANLDGWILVADTRGVNVWCAAGKKTFSTNEVALQVQRAHLTEIVSHDELILPQLAATGVASHQLKQKCGFKGIFGPVRAADIAQFLKNGKLADELMRSVTFTTSERLVLVPVEISLLWKIFTLVVLGTFVTSGIGPDIFSFQTSLQRGVIATGATVIGLLSGALVTPTLLPWIPGRQFWLKGILAGGLSGFFYTSFFIGSAGILENISLLSWIIVISSYTAMNFTGATPYTSLSGVQHEMKRGLPVQLGGVLLAITLWITASFTD